MYNKLFLHIKFKILFIFSLFYISFPGIVYSAESVAIISFPSSKNAGEEFEVNFSASGLANSSAYYMKGLGGNTTTTTFTEIDTWNNGWVQQNGSWISMPTFSANAEGSASATLKVRFDPNVSTNTKDFKLRIRKTDSDTNIDSNLVNISVVAVTPSPTSAPTVAPTKTPSPVPTTVATSKPIVKTIAPIATQSPDPTEESKVESSPDTSDLINHTDTPKPEVLGDNIEKKKVPIIAVLFIFLGISFLGYVGYLIYNQKNAKL